MSEPRLRASSETPLRRFGRVLLALARDLWAMLGPERPQAELDGEARAFEVAFARVAVGVGDLDVMRRAAVAAGPEAMWSVIERFGDGVTGEAWERLTPALVDLEAVRREELRLRHLSVWQRALAARRLGWIRAAHVVPALRQAMERGPRLVTLTAALALARLGDREALEWLLEHPQATDGIGRHQLVALLKRFGGEHVPVLGEAVRGWEVEAPIHLAALEVLGVWGERSALDPLLRLLKEGRPEARVAAARALGGIGCDEAVPALIEALDDYRWAVRAQAARSLGMLGAEEAAPRLAARLCDPVWWVRRHAGYALAAFGEIGRRTLETIADTSRDRYAADMAEEALEMLAWQREREEGGRRVA